MNELLAYVIPAASGLLALGGAYGGVKTALNGTVKRVERTDHRVERIEDKIDGMITAENELSTRIAHLEGACPHCPDR